MSEPTVPILLAELDEADRRAGAAERKLERNRKEKRIRDSSIQSLLERVGEHPNTSLDIVVDNLFDWKQAALPLIEEYFRMVNFRPRRPKRIDYSTLMEAQKLLLKSTDHE